MWEKKEEEGEKEDGEEGEEGGLPELVKRFLWKSTDFCRVLVPLL